MNSFQNINQPIYFSTADLQLESLLDDLDFDRSLLLNILFQPKILIPDIFFFISTGIRNHLTRNESLSLLELGLQKGLIIPAFRDINAQDFTSILSVVNGSGNNENAILGIRFDSSDTALRLDANVTIPEILPWPNYNIGKGYQEIIVKYLSQDEMPTMPTGSEYGQFYKYYWEETKKWRQDCVFDAIKETERIAGEGLRRGLLITEIGRSLGIVKGDQKLNSVSDLLINKVSDKHRDLLQYYCRWLTDCYQFNQAKAFNCKPYFPEFHPISGIMASQFIDSATTDPVDNSQFEILNVELKMPSISTLKKVKPSEIIAIRDEFGADYRKAVLDWQINGSGKEENLRNCIVSYCNSISRETKKRHQILLNKFELTVSRIKNAVPIATALIGKNFIENMADLVSLTALSFAITETGFVCLKGLSRSEKQRIDLVRTKSKKTLKQPDLVIPNN